MPPPAELELDAAVEEPALDDPPESAVDEDADPPPATTLELDELLEVEVCELEETELEPEEVELPHAAATVARPTARTMRAVDR